MLLPFSINMGYKNAWLFLNKHEGFGETDIMTCYECYNIDLFSKIGKFRENSVHCIVSV